MSVDLDKFYEVFADSAMRSGGPENAAEQFTGMRVIDDGQAAELIQRYRKATGAVMDGGPVIKPHIEDSWYPGALPGDRCWNRVQNSLEGQGKGFLVEDLDRTTDVIVGLTPNPGGKPRSARGLVVGYIQSGKTTNFTGVAAKLADRRYRMVIVLAGIHNALRKQTQERLNRDLVGDDGRWYRLTGVDGDFDLARASDGSSGKHDAISYLTSEGKTSLLVVKKNAVILRKLLKWLDKEPVRKALRDAPVLIIDDEADQASVATETINPLIRSLLEFLPRGTYIGYTATPFANVFIDPSDDEDLYPRDFIYPLPRPEGYFGPEELFGRDVLDLAAEDQDGHDMIRAIPDEDEFKLRPTSRKDVDGFVPTLTPAVNDAIRWFVLATAARRGRGDQGDSSMLVHTSFQTKVHDVYKSVIEREIAKIAQAVAAGDAEMLGALRQQWEAETRRVPASDWGRTPETFDEVLAHVPVVMDETRVVADHSYSAERLEYRTDTPNTVIAIGGNTLSRGITLEGLVSSLFIRPTNTYDSLLQMGRWFGFRPGYEDLPRLWTTPTLEQAFRHLSLVEHEMRQDMEVYQLQGVTPNDVAVRIRTHPSLRVTAKMGAASPKVISYSGSRLQSRFFKRYDKDWLTGNWAAGERLLADAMRRTTAERVMDSVELFRNVGVNAVLNFLGEYQVLDRQVDMDLSMIREYIQKQNALDDPQLTKWNVAVVSGSGNEKSLAGLELNYVMRAPLKQGGAVADIKTLMSKEDLVLDVEGMTRKAARDQKEAHLKQRRIDAEETRSKGLVVLYPIDPDSVPTTDRSRAAREGMCAVGPVLGLALVFPKTSYSASERDAVQSTHLAVDLADNPEEIDTDADVYGGA